MCKHKKGSTPHRQYRISWLDAGFLTPGHLHFTRNHGAVPKLDWNEHRIEVSVHAAASAAVVSNNEKSRPSIAKNSGSQEPNLVLKMDDLTSDRDNIKELPVTMACIGNCRSEYNAIRRTIGVS